MPLRQDCRPPSKLGPASHWILFALVLIVIALSTLAFTSPISQEERDLTATPLELTTHDDGIVPGESLSLEPEAIPRTEEDIGYTDGIIIWSTVLVLIILIATLRETILCKKP